MEALHTLLPAELQFLITDRGTHFTAQVFAQFAHQVDFVHVLIARHRPQSNEIAERFVRTLKEWLADKRWESAAELESLLNQMYLEYNDRPHQGLGSPGLSPNAFADRIWLMQATEPIESGADCVCLLQNPGVMVALVGIRNEKELQENVAAGNWTLTPDDRAEIDRIFAEEGVPTYVDAEQAVS